MEKSQTSNLAAVSVIGALTCFLWLPLLPILVPLAVLCVIGKWAASAFMVEEESKNSDLAHPIQRQSSYGPTTPISQGQAQDLKAWQSQASLPYPARVGSLPFSSRVPGTEHKSAKRLRREGRQIARVMAGLDLRRPAINF
jgi:hypothetical protein